jgi:hypothetical protein
MFTREGSEGTASSNAVLRRAKVESETPCLVRMADFSPSIAVLDAA